MIYTVETAPRKGHAARVKAAVESIEFRGYSITEVRRVLNSWWGILGDEDVTKIVYHKKDEL